MELNTETEQTVRVDTTAPEQKVNAMYRDVALDPDGEFHFEMGRALAGRVGYVPADIDAVPSEAIDSFADMGGAPEIWFCNDVERTPA